MGGPASFSWKQSDEGRGPSTSPIRSASASDYAQDYAQDDKGDLFYGLPWVRVGRDGLAGWLGAVSAMVECLLRGIVG